MGIDKGHVHVTCLACKETCVFTPMQTILGNILCAPLLDHLILWTPLVNVSCGLERVNILLLSLDSWFGPGPNYFLYPPLVALHSLLWALRLIFIKFPIYSFLICFNKLFLFQSWKLNFKQNIKCNKKYNSNFFSFFLFVYLANF